MLKNLEIVLTAQERDLGSFKVRRILPYSHCMIGPFIFFDHMGPAEFLPGQGVDVRPHPHINLATVTYLFEGKIRHQDSLGSNQLIEPGAINWMVAGHGIVHSERTPPDLHAAGSHLHGIQCWIALPDEYEEISPSFTHFAAETLPTFEQDGVKVTVLLGSLFNYHSPVKLYSDLFYLDVILPRGTRFTLPVQEEAAAYIVSGKVKINEQLVNHCEMAVGVKGEDLQVQALETAHVMFLGGKSVGERFIYWNFVSSSQEKINQAKREWAEVPGPGAPGTRFPKIPNDAEEFIPLPEEPADKNPKGTIM